jgi:hypothetical protein
MIQPGTYDITIQQGATFNQSFQFKNANDTPFNLTGYALTAEVWEEGKRSKYADFTVSWIDQAEGEFQISLTATQTHTIPQTGYYDILVTNPDGSSDYWLRGQAILETGYTE